MIIHRTAKCLGKSGGERGAVTLAIGILLLLLITLVTLYGSRVTIVEQRISGNDLRAREAAGHAQAGLNYGIEFARAHQDVIRSTDVGGWLDADPDTRGWAVATASVACPADPTPNTIEYVLCNSGFHGEVRFFDLLQSDAVAPFNPNTSDPAYLDTYDVPLDWPASGSGAFSDCPGSGCPIHVELVLCEYDTNPPPVGTCEDAGGTAPQYAVLVLARGVVEDADGNQIAEASVRQAMTLFDLIPGNALPPLMATGNVDVSGDLNIVVNPDGAGPKSGIPLSAWSDGDLIFSGNLRFCYEDGYFQTGGGDLTSMDDCSPDLSNQPCVAEVTTDEGACPLPVCESCACPGPTDYDFRDYLTSAEGSIASDGIDVVDNDNHAGGSPDSTNFPEDVFNYVFGVSGADYEAIKDHAQIEADCSGINDSSSGLYWIEGNCSVSGTVGSPDGPVIIVTEGDFQMQGGGTYFGLVFAFSDPDNGIPGGEVNLRGGAKLYGVVVSDHEIDISNGTFDTIYSECMFRKIISDDSFKRLGPVPGSWADHI